MKKWCNFFHDKDLKVYQKFSHDHYLKADLYHYPAQLESVAKILVTRSDELQKINKLYTVLL